MQGGGGSPYASPAPAPSPVQLARAVTNQGAGGAPLALVEGVPGETIVRDGTLTINVMLSDGTLTITAQDLTNANLFQRDLTQKCLTEVCPDHAPPALSQQVTTFKNMLDAALRAETGDPDAPSSLGEGTHLGCVCAISDVEGKPQVEINITLKIGAGMLAMPVHFIVLVPLKKEADDEARHAMAMDTMHKKFSAEMQRVQHGLELQMQEQRSEDSRAYRQQLGSLEEKIGVMLQQMEQVNIQMNGRVFFGAQHSVHKECTELTMYDPDDPHGPILRKLAEALEAQAAATPTFQIATVDQSGGIIGQPTKHNGQPGTAGTCALCVKDCNCAGACNCNTQTIKPESVKVQLADVAKASDISAKVVACVDGTVNKLTKVAIPAIQDVCQEVLRASFAANTDFLMPLPSSELKPLMLCTELRKLTLMVGKTVTEEVFNLDFLIGLDKLEELTLNDAQIRDIGPLRTLRSLKKLTLSNIKLTGSGVFDLAPLADNATLVEISLENTVAVDNIDALASIASLKKLDLTGTEGLSRTAFTTPGLEFIS